MFGIDDAIIGGLISGGSSLLSGLGARQSAKSSNKAAMAEAVASNASRTALSAELLTNYGTPQSIIKNAQAAGFNPVTWLNSAAGGGMFQAAVLKSYELREPNMPNLQSVPSVMSAVGGALSSGFGTYFNMKQTEVSNQQKQDYLNAMISSIQKRGKGAAGTPSVTTAGVKVSGGGAVAALSMKADTNTDELNSSGLKEDDATVTKLGDLATVDKRVPDGWSLEQRYQGVGGLVTGAADLYKWWNGTSMVDDYRLSQGQGGSKSSAGVDEAMRRAGIADTSASFWSLNPDRNAAWFREQAGALSIPQFMKRPDYPMPNLGYPSP